MSSIIGQKSAFKDLQTELGAIWSENKMLGFNFQHLYKIPNQN